MRLRQTIALAAALGALALAGSVGATPDAQSFIETKHDALDKMLAKPASPARDAEVKAALDGFVDYDSLVHRSFGEPCAATLPNCDDLWAKYDEAQKSKLHDLLKQVIETTYRKNLTKTLDYDVTYKGSRDAGGDTRVLTEAKSKTNPRDTPMRVDYIVKAQGDSFRVVDIITEGSSFSKNLYVQFRKYMADADGYDKIVAKLNEKIAKNS